MVIAPHPDDDVLIASGIVSHANARGDEVKIIFMTNGDVYGVTDGLRRQNEAVAGQVLFLGTAENDLIFLGYPDGGLQPMYANYLSVSSSYLGRNGRTETYGARGLGRVDYHTYRTGAPALYNRPNIIADLQSIIASYLPDHILTLSQYDRHPDHSTTNQLVKLAISAVMAAHPEYNPTLHTTIVWMDNSGLPPVWPELANPTTYHVAPSNLPAALSWQSRESIDVPAAMQTPILSINAKYHAIDQHQAGAQTYLGRFIHKDEIFWAERLGSGPLPLHIDAGFDQTAPINTTVRLNGAASFDPSGGVLAYQWRQVRGPSIALSGASTATPTVIPPASLPLNQVLNFELVVSDINGANATLPDLVAVTFTASAPNPGNTNAAQTNSSGGGGGAMGLMWLAILSAVAGRRCRRNVIVQSASSV
jgi:LmbE family N-acetylglucosaminyl deacetylase